MNEDIIESAAFLIDNSVPLEKDPSFRFVYALRAARALADAGLLVGESDPGEYPEISGAGVPYPSRPTPTESLRRGLVDAEAGRVRPLPWVMKSPDDDFEDGGCVTGCTVRVLSCPCGCHGRH
jgi:hypothetical protein